VDTACIKLYCRDDPKKLVEFLSSQSFSCDSEDCLTVLKEFRRHHASALLLLKMNRFSDAFNIWTQLIKGTESDELFPGIQCLIDNLVLAPENEIWKHVDFILQQDQLQGVKVFIKRQECNKDKLPLDVGKCETIVNFLQQFPEAKMIYLEFLVKQKKLQVEKFHTGLALIYLESIETSASNDEDIKNEKFREKFRQHILQSTCVQFPYLLSRLESSSAGADLHYEKAILYGKMKEHEKALRIFVHNIGDFAEAEQYCNQITLDQPRREKETLLLLFLTVLLDTAATKSTGPLTIEEKTTQKLAAIDLLNRRGDEFRATEVLERLPNDWSLSALAPALMKMTKASTHRKRMVHMEKSLSKSVNLSANLELLQLVREPIILNESSYCVVCKKSFQSCQISRYPNGVIVCNECVKDPRVCPLTGQMFTVQ